MLLSPALQVGNLPRTSMGWKDEGVTFPCESLVSPSPASRAV